MKYFLLLSSFVVFLLCSCGEGQPCSLIICANGGTCELGICECADGYAGESCQELALPDTYAIQQVIISSVPTVDENGIPFDPQDGPDIYLRIQNLDTGSEFTSPSSFEDALANEQYAFEMGGGFAVGKDHNVRLLLFDEDAGGDDQPIGLALDSFSALEVVLQGGGYAGPYTFEALGNTTAEVGLVLNWGF